MQSPVRESQRAWIFSARDLTIPIAFVFSFGFFVYNASHFAGPAYTGSDEVAYLAKAAFLAGKPVDYASSWFAGYSVFLVPAFALFSTPERIWLAVLGTNALLWFGSFVLLGRFLNRAFQSRHEFSKSTINCAVLVSCLYPGWFVLSGYAFPNSAFVFVFMVTLVTLPNTDEMSKWRLIGHCAAIIYLCWIHPAGYAVLLTSIGLIVLQGRRSRRLTWSGFAAITTIFFVFVVSPFIEKMINDAMTPPGFGYPAHYGSHITGQLSDLFGSSHLIGLAKELLTVSSAVIIASFGLVVVAGLQTFRVWRQRDSSRSMVTTHSYCLFSLVGVIGITSLSLYSPARFTMQLDHWIFLRYAEGVLLPILGIGTIGLLESSLAARVKAICLSLAVIAPAAILLQHDLGVRGTTSRVDNHFVMSAGFWPYNIDPRIRFADWIGTTPASAMSYPNFIRWYFAGAIIITFVLVGNRLLLILAFTLGLLLAPRIQTNWHQWLTEEYSTIPDVRSSVHKLTPKTSCTLYDWSTKDKNTFDESYLALTFELVGFGLERTEVVMQHAGCKNSIVISASEIRLDSTRRSILLDRYRIGVIEGP